MDVFPLLETNKIVVAKKNRWSRWETTSFIDPDLIFLLNGTSTKEESGTSGKDEDNNDHNKEDKEDREEDVKNADDNGGGEEEKDETKRKEEETEDHISNLD